MKRAVAEYVAIYDTCQCVKAEHQRLAGLLQPLKIPEWKWEEITMDFIVGLPRSQQGYNSIWIVSGSPDEGRSLHSGEHYLLWCSTRRVVYFSDSVSAWCAEEDHI
jgi:hypothetical protein